MRLAVAAVALAAVAASRGGCGSERPAHDPCAGKECRDACHLCAPDDPGCVETAEPKLCDPGGRCLSSSTSFACPAPDPCAGKACGNTCAIEAPCRFANPPCSVPDRAGQCDAAGLCVPGGAFTCPAVDACSERGCGVPCLPTPDACDGSGSCVPPAALACQPPTEPCAGKACGEPCDPCGGMCVQPAAMACDRRGLCVIGPAGVCPP